MWRGGHGRESAGRCRWCRRPSLVSHPERQVRGASRWRRGPRGGAGAGCACATGNEPPRETPGGRTDRYDATDAWPLPCQARSPRKHLAGLGLVRHDVAGTVVQMQGKFRRLQRCGVGLARALKREESDEQTLEERYLDEAQERPAVRPQPTQECGSLGGRLGADGDRREYARGSRAPRVP